MLVWPRACFAATSLDEQRAVLARSCVEITRGERLWRAFFHPAASACALQDPSFRRSTEGRVGVYLYRRMLDFAQRRLLRESALLHLIYHGAYDPAGALPIWLTPSVPSARANTSRVWNCAVRRSRELPARMLRDAPAKWSLSDISAWMPQPRFEALLAPHQRLQPAGFADLLAPPRRALAGAARFPACCTTTRSRMSWNAATRRSSTRFGVAEIAIRS